MDTLHEENSPPPSPSPTSDTQLVQLPHILVSHNDGPSANRPCDLEHYDNNSRRPSAIIAALRRPSQAVALSAAHAVMNQRRYLLNLFNSGQHDRNASRDGIDENGDVQLRHNRQLGDEALTVILSALYAKLLVVLGMAFPITEIISSDMKAFFYQGFYLYLYIGSIAFVAYMYTTLLTQKALVQIIKSHSKSKSTEIIAHRKTHPQRYGSFYLRLGAIAFGIGSMVYSGLEFGRYFELKNNIDCHSNVLRAITPATRMLLALVQVQFIFLNSRDIQMNRHRIIARFGLMHMIATNLCEWLYVLVEETEHEIIHLEEKNFTKSMLHSKTCPKGEVMGTLVKKASPFLFPCTIEYSLICAVILFEMWKKVKTIDGKFSRDDKDKEKENNRSANIHKDDKISSHFNFDPFGGPPVNSHHHFTVDCSNAHRGLFAGIMIIVLTIISLIMFFVLSTYHDDTGRSKYMAEFEVNIVELTLYVITIIAIIIAMLQMRALKYDRKLKAGGQEGIGMDNTLLVVAQTGMFIYTMFSIIGFTMKQNTIGLLAEIFSFIQTCLQTVFVLDGWWRRCRNIEQTKQKPGRELITFLIIANMAMWAINTLEKNRAEFRPTHLEFFGAWAWTIITHVSMPLAIFYRFHSTICLFEVWKSAYKIKAQYNSPLLQYL